MSVYSIVTEKIITAINDGVKPWERPWRSEDHHNMISGRKYNGVNKLLLEMACQTHFYGHRRWITMNQAKDKGLQIIKGEKSALVTFFTFRKQKNADGSVNANAKEIPSLRYYKVFNVQSFENADEYLPAPTPVDKQSVYAKAQAFVDDLVNNHGLIIKQSTEAAYFPEDDYITMPPIGLFTAAGEGSNALSSYYATLLHEISHWTGHESRLNREFTGRFGTQSYAFEELVAENAASMLCAELGLPYTSQHAAYIGSWLKVLGEDDKAIFTAIRHAKEVHNHLFSEAVVQEVRHAA